MGPVYKRLHKISVSEEANSLAQLTETSTVCGGRGLSPSAGTGQWEPESVWPLGADCQLPHSSSSPPLSLVLSMYASGSLGPGAPITDAGFPLPLLVGSLSWLPASLGLRACLSIGEGGSCSQRGPALAPPLSLFRIQTAATLELLAVLMDPFICHWKIWEINKLKF